ncbi:MAG: FtsK/SpoIIIE domain-containing protein, partial [Anaerolineaceae bacterium]
EVIDNNQFKRIQSPLRFALGKDVSGKPYTVDLARMPHLLIAGTTGSGKSVCVNGILASLLLFNSPADLKLILVDPKRVELTGYNGIPHLLDKVVTEADMVINALQWITQQMDSRYHKFNKVGVRNIEEYNTKFADDKYHYIVVVIDELADLMMLAPDETERAITRLAQLARATGIHLVLATQRPSTDVITGLIKANFPARIAFAVASGVDSRVILDQPGAERLLGRGDMLFQAPDAPAPVRLQGVYVSEGENHRLVRYWKEAGYSQPSHTAAGDNGVSLNAGSDPSSEVLPQGVPLQQNSLWEEAAEESDPVYDDAVDLVRREGRASVTMLQRRMRIGYTRAARLIDRMEEKGIISGRLPNTQTREVLDYGPTAPPEDDGA